LFTKKRLLLLGSAALCAALLLSACGGASSTTSHPPAPSATPPPAVSPTVSAATPTPFCGLDASHPFDTLPFTVSDPTGLRTQTPTGQQAFDAQVKTLLLPYARLTAGLVEVFGGGPDVASGEDFALDAVQALLLFSDQQFIFSRAHTFFQNFSDQSLASNQIRMLLVFYNCGG
jgi:hypothetical protein